MGRGSNKKRKHAQYAQDGPNGDSNIGVGATIAHLRGELTADQRSDEHKPDSEEWTTVGRGGKKQKKTNYPSLGYSDMHKLHTSVNINHLQALVLYCLADATSPQFVSVRHHGMVKKAVVLLVPGLEKGMFDGSIQIDPPKETSVKSSAPYNGANGSVVSSRESEKAVATELEANGYNIKPPPKSPDEYLPTPLSPEKLPKPLKPLADIFSHLWPVKAPGDEKYGKVHSPLHAMLNSAITKTHEEKQEDKQIKGPKPAREGKNWANKRTLITKFLSSAEELEENDYILHPASFTTLAEKEVGIQRRTKNKQTTDDGWLDTVVDRLEDGVAKDEDIEKGSVTDGRSILAIDCEMCIVEGGEMALTRISLVEWDGNVLLDEFVKPDKPIIDYLTPYSGITPTKLENVTTNLKDIQDRLLKEITPKHILIGHSLNSDLMALRLTHPFIIDTSMLYPHPRGPPMKSSLKWLAQKYLGREIQKGHGTQGHDSVEDARACLDLVQIKCERGPQWGTSEATVESIFKRLKRTPRAGSLNNASNEGKTGAIVDQGAPERNFGSMATYCIGCPDDAGVVAGVKRAVLGDEDGSYIPGGGVDFTWARFQELAAFCGWWNDNRRAVSDHTPQDSHLISTDYVSTALAEAVTKTVNRIQAVRDFLPPCTLLVVYSGTGDPRELARLQEMQRTFKREYAVKKWDELSVKWTDTEDQALKMACRKAREGLGFVTIT
ncbi:hypothetical protein HO133_003470 [Letharia lupina]|uniref:Exonuclease domain-containing protein n=2 Tax=Letharia TaxID=112415 RepID=A0A8H6FA51_9LECA|nr:uncharacterized protein HO133_003470 [Letharia lupina]XP_037160876.1 uncharacterized protein HO173_010405 [Letharia columbiana]KAF6220338.1 hypothetical protein HO133_003470 [Letharia lupina]KAF6231444.1 hypothetical protein HO173_010405 [Letharia columbiana]